MDQVTVPAVVPELVTLKVQSPLMSKPLKLERLSSGLWSPE